MRGLYEVFGAICEEVNVSVTDVGDWPAPGPAKDHLAPRRPQCNQDEEPCDGDKTGGVTPLAGSDANVVRNAPKMQPTTRIRLITGLSSLLFDIFLLTSVIQYMHINH